MTLEQFHAVRRWHLGHARPIEKQVWDAVLTLWLAGCVAAPVLWLTGQLLLEPAAMAAWFLPGAYVRLRRGLHRRDWLRCEWITALR